MPVVTARHWGLGGEADANLSAACWSYLKRTWENGQPDDLEKTLMDSNSLYYGDNLDILRRYVQDESVDLIYLDPPFKSDQTYNRSHTWADC